jgi:hypothetical protein
MNPEMIAVYVIIGAVGLIGFLLVVFPGVLMGEKRRLWYLAIGAFFVGLFPKKWQPWIIRFLGAVLLGFSLLAFLGSLMETQEDYPPHSIVIDVKPASTPQPSANPQVIPGTLEEADKLLDDAAKKWEAGDHTGSIDLAEKALEIQIRILGEKHETVTKTKLKIANAKLDLIQEGLNSSSPKP